MARAVAGIARRPEFNSRSSQFDYEGIGKAQNLPIQNCPVSAHSDKKHD